MTKYIRSKGGAIRGVDTFEIIGESVLTNARKGFEILKGKTKNFPETISTR